MRAALLCCWRQGAGTPVRGDDSTRQSGRETSHHVAAIHSSILPQLLSCRSDGIDPLLLHTRPNKHCSRASFWWRPFLSNRRLPRSNLNFTPRQSSLLQKQRTLFLSSVIERCSSFSFCLTKQRSLIPCFRSQDLPAIFSTFPVAPTTCRPSSR